MVTKSARGTAGLDCWECNAQAARGTKPTLLAAPQQVGTITASFSAADSPIAVQLQRGSSDLCQSLVLQAVAYANGASAGGAT